MPVARPRHLSFEFFPPRSEQAQARLRSTAGRLARYRPTFCSVTYGALGAPSRDLTPSTVRSLRTEHGLEVAAHLSCIRTPRREIERLLEAYRSEGVRRLVTIRGDRPGGQEEETDRAPGDGLAHAAELIRLVRARHREHFELWVAAYPECHPEAPSLQADLARLKEKAELGAQGAITQYFYNLEAFERFRDECARMNIGIPLVPGVMPIHDFEQVVHFSARCGAEIPRWLATRFAGYGQREDRAAFALEVVGDLCERLLGLGVPGLHVYTLNRSGPTEALLARLGLNPVEAPPVAATPDIRPHSRP